MSGARDEGAVRFRVEDGVAHLTFDRPAARNAMTWTMYQQLGEAVGRIDADSSIRLAVLRGAGGQAFVAGTDIAQFTEFASGEDGVAYERRIDTYVEALERLRVPTVCVVEGFAIGGGLAIANACDLRVATPGARFGVPIARTLGNCLSPANLRRLSATLGVSMVRRMLLLAEMPTAETLAPLGYLAAIVPPESLDAELGKLTGKLLGHAPVTMAVTREMLRRLAHDPQEQAEDLIRQCYGSDDFRLGVRAFLDKAAPAWTGR
ncbi:enoyl-CoA hydratase/isomerase family protein [Roseomonas sp. OT10]|uniref:enoyl-CoA hydratase/isomerase family protein n=1 Tax=Roseomonas cutis TaxID=2897332 RepID=UPI001E51FE90|nr:enoyl-CoA hydratase/isomerase family protein [Roseomonas sp. OT10]UFN50558.1 enoyl-CoA hydratase/isomerase family protein [Roseomonas sp. OT10]